MKHEVCNSAVERRGTMKHKVCNSAMDDTMVT